MKAKGHSRPAVGSEAAESGRPELLVHKHLRLGWVTILIFISLGIILEGLHAFKVAEYLNPSHATRRLMWTLAHAHGTLLGLLNLGFACSLGTSLALPASKLRLPSLLLRAATVLLPAGFFLGGIAFQGGDPGIGIVLVPLGALALLLSCGLMVKMTWKRPT